MGIEKYLEKGKKSVVHIRIDDKLHTDISRAAKRLEVSITQLVTALMKEFLGKSK